MMKMQKSRTGGRWFLLAFAPAPPCRCGGPFCDRSDAGRRPAERAEDDFMDCHVYLLDYEEYTEDGLVSRYSNVPDPGTFEYKNVP